MSKLNNKTIIETDKKYYLPVFNRYPIALKKGKGAIVWDYDGKKYIDTLAGIAVNSIGHAHPKLVKAISKQASRLIHISNFYASKPQAKLAQELCEISGMDYAFFANSGVEAVEGALKLARKYSFNQGRSGKIISMEGCFHGRTLATIATGKEKAKMGFEPIPQGFVKVPFNDLDKIKEIAEKEGAVAVIIEPIQGEGGVNPSTGDFLKGLRAFCDEKDIILIFDEIQCGMGRTGKFFGYEHFGVEPDVVTLAKALGGGFPIGAILAKEKVAKAMAYGDHGSTFGGNPLACAAALATLDVLYNEKMLEHVRKMGAHLMKRLQKIAEKEPHVKEVRGIGLMVGVELDFPGKEVVAKMLEKGVLCNVTADTTVRFVPPLIIKKKQLDKVIDVFYESLKEVQPQ